MKYTAELKKFITGQSIYSGVRIAMAIVIPAVILAYFGLLKEFFLFPLATSFLGMTDQPGPAVRRRNTLIFAVFCFTFVAAFATLLKDFPPLVYAEIIVFAMFFSMIGVYGQRLAAVGSLALVVMAIFVDRHFASGGILKNLLIFAAGCVWYVVVFMVVSKLQPYKLIGQMIGENYLQLADYLRIKAGFYQKEPDYSQLFTQAIAKQVRIKNHQEETRETVFKTRAFVRESTTESRQLMMMFLNSIDLHEKLMTSENDYRKLQAAFGNSSILKEINQFLMTLANEISHIGISMQGGIRAKSRVDLDEKLDHVYDTYYALRNREMNSESLEKFLVLRQILMRLNEVTDEIKNIFSISSQDLKLAKSLSTGLDYEKFIPKQEKLNVKVLFTNVSLESGHFRHAVRITVALLLGYIISRFSFLGIGHSYWILITITAILKPSYSITKHRNLLRLYGTIGGAVAAYLLLHLITNTSVLLFILLSSMILCFSFLKEKYMWAVFFMTVYIFLTFNFLNPGNIDIIFKDRILDTAIAGAIAFSVSYLVLPVWEHTQTADLMKASAKNNSKYFSAVTGKFLGEKFSVEYYKIRRKEAIVSLANLSDSFQRMISDPKNQQRKMEVLHQFVTTSHLITAYTASLSQYSKTKENYPEIDAESWIRKISAELHQTESLLNARKINPEKKQESDLKPEDMVSELLIKRKKELDEQEFYDRRDKNRITRLTELKNIREIFILIYNTAKEQRKVVEDYYRTNQQS